MNDMLLTVKEVAELRGHTEQAVRKQIAHGKLFSIIDDSSNIKRHLIPLSALTNDERRRVMRDRGIIQLEPPAPPKPKREKKAKDKKRFDEYTAKERQQIAMWKSIVQEWDEYRAKYKKQLSAADELFVKEVRAKYPDLRVSKDILYRKRRAINEEDLDGLVENRGKYIKGEHKVPQEIFNLFEYYYLDDRKPTVTSCIESVVYNLELLHPELIEAVPHKTTFYRYAESLPAPLKVMGREGIKAYEDRCAPYIRRMYDELQSNDYWIADNHTLDFFSQSADGVVHRLYLTMFMEARSWLPVGWNLTDNPNGQSTILALRHGIKRVGAVPKSIYVDNGREFLTRDIGGLGHRQKKGVDYSQDAAPIFARLGIEMTNAIPRNAKAKTIERMFRNITFDLSKLFATYCGGNIMERPESLKKVLKEGYIPKDSEVRDMLDDMLAGYVAYMPYGGPVKADNGLSYVEVYNKNLPETARMAEDGELDLLLMRTSKAQTVGRNGVRIKVSGVECEYGFAELQEYIGQKVYVRYDPVDLRTARVYRAPEDSYLMTVNMNTETLLKFDADPEDVAIGMERIGAVKKQAREQLKARKNQIPQSQRLDALDLRIRKAHQNLEGGEQIKRADKIQLIITDDTLLESQLPKGTKIEIDMSKINDRLLKVGG